MEGNGDLAGCIVGLSGDLIIGCAMSMFPDLVLIRNCNGGGGVYSSDGLGREGIPRSGVQALSVGRFHTCSRHGVVKLGGPGFVEDVVALERWGTSDC